MTDCIFCKIINKEIPTKIIYEDERVVAFLDHKPKAAGHTLVVHKIHSDDLLSTSDEVLGELISKTKIIAQQLMTEYKAVGFNLAINNGSAAGQDVFHLHFHIIPRS